MAEKGHSEDYFGEERDFWWNKDYLDLLANRWGLNKYSKLLDVGCGCCHWSKLLSNYLHQPSEIYALDYDSKWAEGADSIKEYFKKCNATVTFMQGDAQELPFPDEFFDVVTCQTVLIHLKNPAKAVSEMKRVLKKGGILICVEMNNIAGALVRNSLMEDEPIEETLNRLKYHLIYEKGKKILGEGDNSIGDFLPGIFAEVGFEEIKVYLSDKASPIFPPYTSEEEIATLNTLQEWIDNDKGDLDYERALRYFKAVSEEQENIDFFNSQYALHKAQMQMQMNSVKTNQFNTGGAYVMYIVSGRK